MTTPPGPYPEPTSCWRLHDIRLRDRQLHEVPLRVRPRVRLHGVPGAARAAPRGAPQGAGHGRLRTGRRARGRGTEVSDLTDADSAGEWLIYRGTGEPHTGIDALPE